jgi:hypothetical protein
MCLRKYGVISVIQSPIRVLLISQGEPFSKVCLISTTKTNLTIGPGHTKA